MSKLSPKDNILYTLKDMKIPFVTEHKFHPTRRFKFDYAIPHLKIAIEYEGLMASKSRHTTISGYTKDCQKYNIAVKEGWRVLRYTALNYQELRNDLLEILSKTTF